MDKNDFLNEHERYGDIGLTESEERKLKGLPIPGSAVAIHWQDVRGELKCIDYGYLFLLPFQDAGIDDYFIHVPNPSNPGGIGDVESEWAHINKLLKNESVKQIIVINHNN